MKTLISKDQKYLLKIKSDSNPLEPDVSDNGTELHLGTDHENTQSALHEFFDDDANLMHQKLKHASSSDDICRVFSQIAEKQGKYFAQIDLGNGSFNYATYDKGFGEFKSKEDWFENSIVPYLHVRRLFEKREVHIIELDDNVKGIQLDKVYNCYYDNRYSELDNIMHFANYFTLPNQYKKKDFWTFEK